MDPYRLPVYQQRDKILSALADNQVIVVESPTGSGKTTQIPLILHEAGYTAKGTVGVTQPRRIAAVSVSDFIARQIGTTIPRTVGYTMRFEDRTDESTVIKIMTDGILLQELKGDRDLSRYGVLMIDEAHERSLNIDFILGMLKDILARRPDFRVIVSSATINVEVFSEYFDGCPVVTIDAPLFPVQLVHEPPEAEGDWESLQRKIVEIVSRVMKQGKPGDVLVFLPGELAIKNCMQALLEMDTAGDLAVLPLYARLSHEDQGRVFLPVAGKRKVIIATNIAETSVTIDGVVTVIDSGLAKINYYSPKTFTESLVEVPVSKASCNQRKGRAGRTAPGSATGCTAAPTTRPGRCTRPRRSCAPTSRRSCCAWPSWGSATSTPSTSSPPRVRRASGRPWTPCGCWTPSTRRGPSRRPAHSCAGFPSCRSMPAWSWRPSARIPPSSTRCSSRRRSCRSTLRFSCPRGRRWRRAARTTPSAIPWGTSSPTCRCTRPSPARATRRGSASAPTSTCAR